MINDRRVNSSNEVTTIDKSIDKKSVKNTG